MVGLTARPRPAELAAVLGALEVRVESVRVEPSAVPLPDYPGGPRPSSVLRLTGGGQVGLGENVAFFENEHERFAAYIESWFRAHGSRAGRRVDQALDSSGTLYERAALEASLIDLGLRQAGLSLGDLTGLREASVRFVVSLAVHPEPLAVIARLRAAGYTADLKLDVEPSWAPTTLQALAQDASIAIFDFKGRGNAALARELRALNPQALFEDPPSGFEESNSDDALMRTSRDASLSDANAVVAARARGEWVNLKAPRMGGVLELLRGLEHAGESAYLGGMFEVGVGRAQARQLAAIYCAAAPNDLAPNVPSTENVGRAPANSPTLIRLDQVGFGSGCPA